MNLLNEITKLENLNTLGNSEVRKKSNIYFCQITSLSFDFTSFLIF